ncbi:MAG: thiamine pyrophosphate-dependent enzyme, partial [Bacteroidales bacterium]|nr:thiamine pyrophosphate-dependent enzyme [Bacteroidales bacterium]
YRYEQYIPPVQKFNEDAEHNEWLCQDVAGMINGAEKPLIIVGQGVIISGAENQVLKIAESGNIPVISTLMGLSAFPTTHRLFAGFAGMHGNIAPNLMTQQSDLILAVGMRFSDRVTGDVSKYAPKAKIIHIDIDDSEFNKTVRSHVSIKGDASRVLKSISPGVKYRERPQWWSFIDDKRMIEKERIISRDLTPVRGTKNISMAMAVDALARIGGGEPVVVTDVGQNQMFSARYSKFNKTRSMITSGGLGTMGFGLPAGIGAKLGVPDRQVVVITGDGGFQMSLQELGTIMQSGIDVKIMILNNSFLGMVRQWQELFFEGRYSFTSMDNPDFMKIASAYNIKCARIERAEDLDSKVKEMLDCKESFLLEVVVDKRENVFPMVPSGAPLDNIILK